MRAILFTMSLLMFSALIAGCCGSPCGTRCDSPCSVIDEPTPPDEPSEPSDELHEVFAESDSGRSVTVDQGDSFKVRLIGRPGTGFSWRRVPAEGSVLELAGEPTSRPLNPGLAGGKAEIVYTFTAARTGSETLTMEYIRGWDPDAKPGATFTLEVLVK